MCTFRFLLPNLHIHIKRISVKLWNFISKMIGKFEILHCHHDAFISLLCNCDRSSSFVVKSFGVKDYFALHLFPTFADCVTVVSIVLQHWL